MLAWKLPGTVSQESSGHLFDSISVTGTSSKTTAGAAGAAAAVAAAVPDLVINFISNLLPSLFKLRCNYYSVVTYSTDTTTYVHTSIKSDFLPALARVGNLRAIRTYVHVQQNVPF